MKKTTILALAVVAASVVSAGTVTWSADILKGSDPLSGTIAYLFVGDSVVGVADAVVNGSVDYSSAIASGYAEGADGLYVNKIGSYSSQTVSLYMIAFDAATVADAKNFAVSGPVSQTFGASGNKTFNFGTVDSWQAVPEPTTVALLALGLAAVGLKRKVA